MSELQGALDKLSSGEEGRAEKAVESLAEIGPPAIDSLGGLLEDRDPEARWWAVRALAEINDPRASELITQALGDEEAAVRQCAAVAMRIQPNKTAVPSLIPLLGGDDRLLAQLAGDALIAIGKAATGALIEVVENGEQAARLEAVRALARMQDQDSIPTLFKLLDEDSALMAYWANEGLERMGVGMAFFMPG